MKSLCKFAFLFVLIAAALNSQAQQFNEYGFKRWSDLPVSVEGLTLPNAWAGGVNNVQSGMMDMNGDGYDDLLLFDRHGDRLLPFLYMPTTKKYLWSPEYRDFFPAMEHWFQLVDYNHDGFMDIFTYTPGGIMIYKNSGTIPPSFVKAVDPYLTSLQGSIYTNLLVTNVDYPAIVDLDGDGDYDILTFWGLGSFVELHTNLSMETTGNADSLLFKRTQICWGEFAENPESNTIYLDTCNRGLADKSAEKHTGSTFCLIDLNGDKVLDLILGDVDYPEPAILINGGDNVQARMVAQWPDYPLNDPVHLWSFPLVQQLDIYQDGRPALLASPFDPSLVKSRGNESLWLYKDVSTSLTLDYQLQTKSFLQDGMIDLGLGAYPIFTDLNNDGLKDLVVSNFGSLDTCMYNDNMQLKCHYSGRLQLYRNFGTLQIPEYELIDDDFGDIAAYAWVGLYPAFADLDNDGNTDMVLGESSGKLWYFENTASPGEWPVFATPVTVALGIQYPAFPTPQLLDLDEDGDFDLVMGGREGRLSYYENTGTPSAAAFTLVTDNFGKVNVTDSSASYAGYSVPCFFRNPENEWALMVGSESGRLFYYEDIRTEADTRFTLVSNHFMYITEGIRTAPALADINGDGFVELALGNYGGGVVLFKGSSPQPAGWGEVSIKKQLLTVPNPATESVNLVFPDVDNWRVEMRSVQGKLVHSFSLKNSDRTMVDLKGFSTGIYLIQATGIKDNNHGISGKLVVIR